MPENLPDSQSQKLAQVMGVKPTQSAELPQSTQTMTVTPVRKFYQKKWFKFLAVFASFLLIALVIMAIIGIYTLSIVTELQAQGRELSQRGQASYLAFKAQNLPESEAQLKSANDKLGEVRSTYSKLSFYKYVPVLRNYYLDGEHGLNAANSGMSAGLKTLAAITPYADVLGFSGEGTFAGGTAEDRVKLILETLKKVDPELDSIASDLDQLNTELAMINENRYPEQIRSMVIKSNIIQAKDIAANADLTLKKFRPIISYLPEIAGADGKRKKYLVLFQNDNELRATGGFLTAYSVIYIENGKVLPEKSDDIYELDKKFTKRIPIPQTKGKYLTTEKYFNLRDMNIDPDFKRSMDLFLEHYKEVRGEPTDIDGVIAIDTEVLTGLVKIVGPVEIPGYGTFTAENDKRCDCPQIIYALSEIITKPTPYIREDRKGIIGPLMQTILQKVYSSPRVYMAQLFELGLKSVDGRHMQVVFFNENHQTAAENINAAGRLEYQPNQADDFVAIVNSNLGGAKSNLFTDYKVTQTVTGPENGKVEKTLEITYQNSRPGDNCNLEAGQLCLNSTLRDWTRIYVKPGSELISAVGFTTEPKLYEENGFMVIDGFFILEPNNQAKLKITYQVPYESTDYSIKVWKQGGITSFPMIFNVNGSEEEVLVDKDTVYKVSF